MPYPPAMTSRPSRQSGQGTVGPARRHARAKPPTAKLVKSEKRDGYTLEHLELDLNGIEPVPAYLLLPDKRQKAPGLLYIHAHGGTYDLGKEELLKGRKVLPAYAPVCAEKGIVTLAIDSWCFVRPQARRGRPHRRDGTPSSSCSGRARCSGA